MTKEKILNLARPALTPEELNNRAEQLSLMRQHNMKTNIIVSLTIVAMALVALCAFIVSHTMEIRQKKMDQDFEIEKAKSRACGKPI